MGGYIFSHKIRLRPRLLKQFIPKKIIEEILLYDHKVICQDVFQKDPRTIAERAKRNPWGYICPGAISGVKGQYQSVSAQPPNRFTLYINQNHLFLISSLYQDSGFHRHYETLGYGENHYPDIRNL